MLRCYLTGYILTSRTTARQISSDLFSSQHAADDMKITQSLVESMLVIVSRSHKQHGLFLRILILDGNGI